MQPSGKVSLENVWKVEEKLKGDCKDFLMFTSKAIN